MSNGLAMIWLGWFLDRHNRLEVDLQVFRHTLAIGEDRYYLLFEVELRHACNFKMNSLLELHCGMRAPKINSLRGSQCDMRAPVWCCADVFV